MAAGDEVLVERGEVTIWAESLGSPAHPAVLLVAGADSSSRRWPDALLGTLQRGGLRVLRFDHRDTGRSTMLPPSAAYDLDAMVADAVAVLDAFGVARAHVLGHSMGGMIAQLLALDHPDRVASLVLVGTTPAPDAEELPPPDDDLVLAIAERRFAPLPKERADRIEWHVELARLFAGSRYPFDEGEARSLAEAEVDRAWRPETGHGTAVFSSPGRIDRLDRITCPTLVVHGTADGIYPPAHAQLLAARIPGAELVLLDGLGHEVPTGLWEELAPQLLDHLGVAPTPDA